MTLGYTTPTSFISTSPSNPTVGQQITFVDTITGSSSYSAPTGTVTWVVTGAANACTSFTSPASAPHTTAYGCVIATPVSGTYTVTATYSGDINYSSLPTSSPTSVEVTPATPIVHQIQVSEEPSLIRQRSLASLERSRLRAHFHGISPELVQRARARLVLRREQTRIRRYLLVELTQYLREPTPPRQLTMGTVTTYQFRQYRLWMWWFLKQHQPLF